MEVDRNLHPSGIVPQLQNVVCTVNLGTKLDLKEIALHAKNAEYNPKRFAAVIMRIREPKTTALIFTSGKMVCTGAKSEEDARTAARKFAKIVQKLGFAATFREFKIQNIVGSCDVKFPIRLEGMQMSHKAFANYEPELFPGLIYRMVVPKVVLLVFVSGKVVLTGAKQRTDIYAAFDNIYPILQNFRKGVVAQAGAATPQTPLALPPLAPTPLVPLAFTPAAGAGPSGLHHPTPQHQHQHQGEGAAEGTMGPPSPRRLPPPTPAHHMLPPPSPAHPGLTGAMTHAHMDLPPPTPAHH